MTWHVTIFLTILKLSFCKKLSFYKILSSCKKLGRRYRFAQSLSSINWFGIAKNEIYVRFIKCPNSASNLHLKVVSQECIHGYWSEFYVVENLFLHITTKFLNMKLSSTQQLERNSKTCLKFGERITFFRI